MCRRIQRLIRPLLPPLHRLRPRAESLNDREKYQMDEPLNPLFSFGVIADIQYADKDDGYNYVQTRMRYYRNSLCLLRDATQEWASETLQPAFILQLGDIIDGFNVPLKTSDTSLSKILNEFEKLKIPVHHIWGNHEFYNFSRKQLMESKLNSMWGTDTLTTSLKTCMEGTDTLTTSLKTHIVGTDTLTTSPKTCMGGTDTLTTSLKTRMGGTDTLTTSLKGIDDPESFYAYHFSPFPNFRLLLIDSYDFSVIGRETSSQPHRKALKHLKQRNKNEDLNSPTGLSERQFVLFNGGIGSSQMKWMRDVLETSDKNGEKVIVAGHLPIYPPSTDPICLTWNYQEVLSLLQAHPCVVAYFSGHDHDGGYCQDSYGIHHVTFNGIIETPPDSQAFATTDVYEDRMVLRGRGLVPHRVLTYRKS